MHVNLGTMNTVNKNKGPSLCSHHYLFYKRLSYFVLFDNINQTQNFLFFQT